MGALDPSEREAFVDHLVQCEFCHNEVYSMAPVMKVMRDHREAVLRGEFPADRAAARAAVQEAAPPPPFLSFWLKRPMLAAASLLVAFSAGLMVMYLVMHQPTTQVAQHIPIPTYRPNDPTMTLRGNEAAFKQAMEAFQQNDFEGAAKQLEVLCRLEKDNAEGHFYWGVSLLSLGRNQDAVSPLKKAVEFGTGELRESSRYYLALAYHKTGQTQQALTELEAVIQMNGSYRAKAEELKKHIGGK
jgi:hypothetical protein